MVYKITKIVGKIAVYSEKQKLGLTGISVKILWR